MANEYRLNTLRNCLNKIQVVSYTFERIVRQSEETDEIQDKGICIEASDRLTVELNKLKKMLQEDIMIEELT